MKNIISIWQVLSGKVKQKFFIFFSLSVASALADVLVVGMTAPLLTLMMSGNQSTAESPISLILNNLGLSNSGEITLFMAMFFVIILTVSGILRVAVALAQQIVTQGIGTELSTKIFRNSLYQSYASHISNNSSDFISLVTTKLNVVINTIISPALSILSSGLTSIGILIFMLFYSPVFTIVAILFVLLNYLLITGFVRRALARDGLIVAQETKQASRLLTEASGGIREITLDNLQELYLKSFRRSDTSLRQAYVRMNTIAITPRYLVETSVLVVLTLLGYSLSNDKNFAAMIPSIGIVGLAALKLLPSFQLIYTSWSRIRGGQVVFGEVVDHLISRTPTRGHCEKYKLFTFRDSIELSNVTFFHKNSSRPTLSNISLQIRFGQRVGIVGKSGCGKSTLLDLIMGLLEPSSGKLLVDGKHLVEKNLRSWQGIVSHVPQSIFLVDASVAENIAFGVPSADIDLERLIAVCRHANILNDIQAWTEGFNTRVGERGILLSGGLRQRVGIARALYKNPTVLIMDEATSALDLTTEEQIIADINSMSDGMTIIVVSHRPSSLKHCDQILQLHAGKLRNSQVLP